MAMTRVLLDTSAYSAFMRGHPQCKRAIQEAEEIVLTPIILGELITGFMRGKWKEKNNQELRTLLSSSRVSIVGLDEATADRYAVILNSLWKAGTPIPTNVIWIAASAMQHGLRVLTTDTHYQKISQVIVDYFEMS
jgi:tRNA(fMet)-specific endonuclease VapC